MPPPPPGEAPALQGSATSYEAQRQLISDKVEHELPTASNTLLPTTVAELAAQQRAWQLEQAEQQRLAFSELRELVMAVDHKLERHVEAARREYDARQEHELPMLRDVSRVLLQVRR